MTKLLGDFARDTCAKAGRLRLTGAWLGSAAMGIEEADKVLGDRAPTLNWDDCAQLNGTSMGSVCISGQSLIRCGNIVNESAKASVSEARFA